MKIYRNSIFITGALSVVSIILAAILNFSTSADTFWCNALLGLFGSGVLTLITSIIGYCVERRRTFEGFSYTTKAILRDLNKYQLEWSLEKKVDFFLDYHDISRFEWDKYFGDFCFLADRNNANRQYIYKKIYFPLKQVDEFIGQRIWNLRWYKDGARKSDTVIEEKIHEIEQIIMSVDTVQESATTIITTTQNILVHTVAEEMSGHFYELMYVKKKRDMNG